jgi:hypothetical protein
MDFDHIMSPCSPVIINAVFTPCGAYTGGPDVGTLVLAANGGNTLSWTPPRPSKD